MTQQEITEGNKLIAEFMGFEYIPWNNEHEYKAGYWSIEAPHIMKVSSLPIKFGNKAYLGRTVFNLKYHLSWDWLMPVVEKIEQQYTVKIIRYADECSNICEIETTEEDPLQITYCYGYDYDSKTKIQIVFDAVVEFIKWYNEHK